MLKALFAVPTVAIGVAVGAVAGAGPAQADAADDAFANAVAAMQLGPLDMPHAIQVGRSVCPQLTTSSQSFGDVAGMVANSLGLPPVGANMVTRAAIWAWCPHAPIVAGAPLPPPLLPVGPGDLRPRQNGILPPFGSRPGLG